MIGMLGALYSPVKSSIGVILIHKEFDVYFIEGKATEKQDTLAQVNVT